MDDSCPVGLWWSHGNYNQQWRISGNKVFSGHPATLVQDPNQNIVGIYGSNNENAEWDKLTISNHLCAHLHGLICNRSPKVLK